MSTALNDYIVSKSISIPHIFVSIKFSFTAAEAQKKKRNEAQQSRTLTLKQSITNDNNKDHSRKGSRTKS